MKDRHPQSAFTLIELSIVLVIIGLIVGGVLVGRDLISAATVRAQITQIEKFQTAKNTFRQKYDALPGDITAAAASQFGFAARGLYAGEGDGNGRVESITGDAANSNISYCGISGEAAMFWVDLSQANLIDGSFTTATSTAAPPTPLQGSMVAQYLPQAKAGAAALNSMPSIYIFSTGTDNYFGAGGFYNSFSCLFATETGTFSVKQAYNIDKKIDDGLPQFGSVIAAFNYGTNAANNYSYSAGEQSALIATGPTTAAQAASTTSCFDNGSTSQKMAYSLAQSSSTPNCALAFKFQ